MWFRKTSCQGRNRIAIKYLVVLMESETSSEISPTWFQTLTMFKRPLVSTEGSRTPFALKHTPHHSQRPEVMFLLSLLMILRPSRSSTGSGLINSDGESGFDRKYTKLIGDLRNPLLWLFNGRRDPENPMLRCEVAKVLENPDEFAVRGYPIDYCLTREWPKKCRLQFSLIILCVVIVGNCIKAACMLATLCVDIEGLVTIGDAISSFLKTPDETTIGMCIVNRRTIKNTSWKEISRATIPWKVRSHFWLQALSTARWLTCNVL